MGPFLGDKKREADSLRNMHIALAWRFTFAPIIRLSGVVVSHIGCFKV
jgi:hypothetical protein